MQRRKRRWRSRMLFLGSSALLATAMLGVIAGGKARGGQVKEVGQVPLYQQAEALLRNIDAADPERLLREVQALHRRAADEARQSERRNQAAAVLQPGLAFLVGFIEADRSTGQAPAATIARQVALGLCDVVAEGWVLARLGNALRDSAGQLRQDEPFLWRRMQEIEQTMASTGQEGVASFERQKSEGEVAIGREAPPRHLESVAKQTRRGELEAQTKARSALAVMAALEQLQALNTHWNSLHEQLLTRSAAYRKYDRIQRLVHQRRQRLRASVEHAFAGEHR